MKKYLTILSLVLFTIYSNAQSNGCDTNQIDSLSMTFNQYFADSFYTEIGKTYTIVISGTYGGSSNETRDAAYGNGFYNNYIWEPGTAWKWNGATPQRPDPDVLDSIDHTYFYTFTASDSFQVFTFTDAYYGDNYGELRFGLWENCSPQQCDTLVFVYDTTWVNDTIQVYDTMMVYDTVQCDTNMIDSMAMTFSQAFSDSFYTEIGKSYKMVVSGTYGGSSNETRDAAYANGFFNGYTWDPGSAWKWNGSTPQRPDPDMLDSIDHTYFYTFTANDSFQVFTFTDGYYGDNYGELRFGLWEDCTPQQCDTLINIYDTTWVNDTIQVYDTMMVYDTVQCDTNMIDSMAMTFNQAFSDTLWTEIGKNYTMVVMGTFAGSSNETRDAAYGNGFFNNYTWAPGTTWKWNGATPQRPNPDIVDSINHTYYYTFTANDSIQVFTFDDTNYGDNSGTLYFGLWENCEGPNTCDTLVHIFDTTMIYDTTMTMLYDTMIVYDTIQCDTILVDSMVMTFNQEFSDSFWTEIGKSYHFVISGTFAGASNETRDAAYGNGSYNGYSWTAGTTWKWNGATPQRPDPDVLDTIDHTYFYSFTAVDSYQVLSFSDGNYNDNSGSLHFELWETSCGYDLCDSLVLVYDTMLVNDTMWVSDTINVLDTVTTTIYDTTFVTVTDTLLIDVATSLSAPLNQNTIKVYPNPGKTIINIEHTNYLSMAGYSISIYNSSAQNVYNSQITSAMMSVNISSWSAGTYFLQLYDSGSNLIEIRHIVIQ